MSVAKPEDVPGLYRQVYDLLEKQDYQKAIPVISRLPVDYEQTRTLVFCCLNCERWSAADRAIDAYEKQVGKSTSKDTFVFERAYILYKLNRPLKALEILNDIKSLNPEHEIAAKNLKAQLLHRIGHYDESREIYESLLEDDPTNEMLLTNYLATIACKKSTADVEIPKEINANIQNTMNSTTYELLFNLACFEIGRKNYTAAEDLLLQALEKCGQELEVSDYKSSTTAFEYGELVGVMVQLAYVYDLQQRFPEALEIYQNTIKRLEYQQMHPTSQKSSAAIDAAVSAVANANMYIHQYLHSKNPEDSVISAYALEDAIKRATRISGQALQHRLTCQQAMGIGFVQCLSLLQANKLENCKRLIASISSRWGSNVSLECLRAMVQIKSGNYQKAEDIIKRASSLDASPEENIRLNIACASLRLYQGDVPMAKKTLRGVQQECIGFMNQKNKESLIADVFSLQKQCGDPEAVLETLHSQVKALPDFKDEHGLTTYINTVLSAAVFSCSIERWETAATHYQNVLKALSSNVAQKLPKEYKTSANVQALVGIVETSVFLSGIESCQTHLSNLSKALPPRVALLDSDEIEKQECNTTLRNRSKQTSSAAKTGMSSSKTDGKIRKKKIRYPKGFDPKQPQIPPDPERWLPKHERSGYKKMLRRRKELVRGGAQGAVLPNCTETTMGFRNSGPTTATTEAARDTTTRGAGGRRKAGRR